MKSFKSRFDLRFYGVPQSQIIDIARPCPSMWLAAWDLGTLHHVRGAEAEAESAESTSSKAVKVI